MATLSRDDYRRKVYGCWLGKSVGGTLGQPHEGRMEVLNLTFYDPVPTGAIANDDLDLQLVWLAALRAEGPTLDERGLGRWWQRSLQYPWDEYGMGLWNLNRGIAPPVSGQYANPFGDCMGSPIRSEIWACCAPGLPELAAEYAYCDACVDHTAEGISGEIFFAALESAAFVESDTDRLLDIGLAMIPAASRTAGAVRLTRRLYAEGLDWLTARNRVLDEFGHVNFTDAPQNIAFTVLGWLWGTDAGDGMCKAVNCGYDTDCTGATLGSILGLIHGPEVFEPRWVEPIGDDVVVGWGVHHCEVPASLQELSDWTLQEAERVMAHHHTPLRLGEVTDLSDLAHAAPSCPPSLQARLDQPPWTLRVAGEADGRAVLAWLDLGGSVGVTPGQTRQVAVRVDGTPLPVRCTPPAGWTVRDTAPGQFELTAPAALGAGVTYPVGFTIGAQAPLEAIAGLVPACGWQLAGPVAVADAAAALSAPPATGEWREWWTPDHRLMLDDGGDTDRVYRLRTRVTLTAEREARLVVATPDRQVVTLDGEVGWTKADVTPFIPAAHRSGAGTAGAVRPWPAAGVVVEVLLAVRAGHAAEVHVFLTRSNDVDGPKLVPWEDQALRLP